MRWIVNFLMYGGLIFDNEYKNIVTMADSSSVEGFEHLLQVFKHLENEKVVLHILTDEANKEMIQQKKR